MNVKRERANIVWSRWPPLRFSVACLACGGLGCSSVSGQQRRGGKAVVSGLTLNTDDVIQVMTGTGAGWGDPMERPLELVKQDLKNGYITLEQANRYYGLDKRGTSG
ncbi:MAG: hypothetical protein ACETWR_11585 [Anaerolineae bacterium]